MLWGALQRFGGATDKRGMTALMAAAFKMEADESGVVST